MRDFFRSGQKQWDGFLTTMNPDYREGEANWYYENGYLNEKVFYNANLLNGPYKKYNGFGNLITDATYLNDSLNGRYLTRWQ